MLIVENNLILGAIEEGGGFNGGLRSIGQKISRWTDKTMRQDALLRRIEDLEARGFVKRHEREERYVFGPKETFSITEEGRRLLDRSEFRDDS